MKHRIGMKMGVVGVMGFAVAGFAVASLTWSGLFAVQYTGDTDHEGNLLIPISDDDFDEDTAFVTLGETDWDAE
ncbi:MAG: hypothetical protein FWF84_04910, partial [Kiritimatiellaeota bacterium]|nr:hypothetical protein [Kiritimatiellota bacterium]